MSGILFVLINMLYNLSVRSFCTYLNLSLPHQVNAYLGKIGVTKHHTVFKTLVNRKYPRIPVFHQFR